MKKFNGPLSISSSILLALSLPLVLVAVGVLGFLLYHSPGALDRVTAPIRAGAEQAGAVCQTLWEHWSSQASAAARQASADIQASLRLLADPPPASDGEVQLVDGPVLPPPPSSSGAVTITTLAVRNGRE